ncbi:MAG TPA: c-type cytochrome [Pseudomonadales bacterium]|nr:c-type cytochrome [Pseudomonadales bacterium]
MGAVSMRRAGMRTAGLLAAILLAVAASGCAPASPADALLKDPAALQRGKLLYTGTCGGYCHNSSSGASDAPSLTDCTWLHGGSDQEVFDSIAGGYEGTRMIGFAGKLPEGDADIWRLVAYLKSARQC